MTLLEGSTAKTTSTITKLSFHEFKKLKEDQRTKKIEANKKVKAIRDVKIQIRVMEELDGHLKRIKGRTLPLVVPLMSPQKHSWKQLKINIPGTSNSLINLWTMSFCIQTRLLSTPCLEVLFFSPLTNIKKNLKNLFPNCAFGCVVPQTSKAVLISWKKSLNRAVSQGHHTFQTLPPQLQKWRKEMAH